MQELVRGYHRDGVPRCAIKIDLMKVYMTRFHWQFLFDTMGIMGFPSLFVHWIKQCVCTAKYILW